jgi:hypothetical protein
MARLNVLGITVEKTKEARDEPFLKAAADNEPLRTIWGPIRMDDGEARSINHPIEFNQRVVVQAWEHDEHGRDVKIGNDFVLTERDRGEIRNLFSGHRARYRVSVDVSEAGAADFDLELLSLTCANAERTTDRAYLTVNDRRVWGPVDMHTGDTQRIALMVPIHGQAVVELWEEDPSLSDKLGTIVARPTDGSAQTQSIYWRSPGGHRNALYHLSYRVTPH